MVQFVPIAFVSTAMDCHRRRRPKKRADKKKLSERIQLKHTSFARNIIDTFGTGCGRVLANGMSLYAFTGMAFNSI